MIYSKRLAYALVARSIFIIIINVLTLLFSIKTLISLLLQKKVKHPRLQKFKMILKTEIISQIKALTFLIRRSAHITRKLYPGRYVIAFHVAQMDTIDSALKK
jgi:hypothetical protein